MLRHHSYASLDMCPINSGQLWDTFWTRLETRTKESIYYASKWVYETYLQKKLDCYGTTSGIRVPLLNPGVFLSTYAAMHMENIPWA
jgi:hypothetical protein